MNLPVIFVSGKGSDAIGPKPSGRISALIEKPFKKDSLLKAVHKPLRKNPAIPKLLNRKRTRLLICSCGVEELRS